MNSVEILRTLLFGYPVMPEMVDKGYPLLVQMIGGLSLTVAITLASLALGTPLGLVLALMQRPTGAMENPRFLRLLGGALRLLSRGAVHLLAALPILVIVLLTFHLPFALFHLRVPAVILAIFAFSLLCGIYLCNIFLSGFSAVAVPLHDAAVTLGLSRLQTLGLIVLPIAIRTMIPSLLGIIVTIFMDSAALVVVAVPELMYTARQMIGSTPGSYAPILAIVLTLYWLGALVGTAVIHHLETVWNISVDQIHRDVSD